MRLIVDEYPDLQMIGIQYEVIEYYSEQSVVAASVQAIFRASGRQDERIALKEI